MITQRKNEKFLLDTAFWLGLIDRYERLHFVRRLYQLAVVKKLENVEALFEQAERCHFKHLAKLKACVYDVAAHRESYKNEIEKLLQMGVFVLPYSHPNFPVRLRFVDDPPCLIYGKGNFSLLNKKTFGMVGARQCSHYGQRMSRYFSGMLSQKGYVIVSGLAYGIDSCAHRQALKSQGDTIAVLGNGLFHYYPKDHRILQETIAQKGLLLSEYQPFSRPKRYHFPERNRIIAGLSDRLMVVEAGVKSGSLITATMALDQGKDVYALPGDIDRHSAQGSNKLIQDGAYLVMNEQELIE